MIEWGWFYLLTGFHMSIELISVQGLWPLVRRVPWLSALLARWYFTVDRLAGLVYVDLYPRHEAAHVDLGLVATFQLHLQIINLSPFELELEQANFHFWVGGVKLEVIVVKKQRIASGASTSLFLSGNLNDGQANQIAMHHKQNSASLDGNIEFKCRVSSFARQVPQLSGVQVVVINEKHRNPKD